MPTSPRRKRPRPYEAEEERAAAADGTVDVFNRRPKGQGQVGQQQEEEEEGREDASTVPCKFYHLGHCLRGDHCSFKHEDCGFGVECTDFQGCKLGHPQEWKERRKAARPCRRFRTGFCPYGDQCRYIHQMCELGLTCQSAGCRLGHPPEWRCYGCEKCHYGVTGAGILLVTPSHQQGQFDLVLVEEMSRDVKPTREWGDMGGRIDARDDDDKEDGEEEEGDGATGTSQSSTAYANQRLAALAVRELLEETAGTVKVEASRVAGAPFVDTGIYHRYRCFLLLEEPVSIQLYQQARKQPGLPRAYRESLDMRRFPLETAVAEMAARRRKRLDAAAAAAEAGAAAGGDDTTTTTRLDDDGCLLGRHIHSHKGKAHALAERCRQVLSLAYEKGLLDPYYTVAPPQPPPAAALLQAPPATTTINNNPPLLQPTAAGIPSPPSVAATGAVRGVKRKPGLLRPPGMMIKPPQPAPQQPPEEQE